MLCLGSTPLLLIPISSSLVTLSVSAFFLYCLQFLRHTQLFGDISHGHNSDTLPCCTEVLPSQDKTPLWSAFWAWEMFLAKSLDLWDLHTASEQIWTLAPCAVTAKASRKRYAILLSAAWQNQVVHSMSALVLWDILTDAFTVCGEVRVFEVVLPLFPVFP